MFREDLADGLEIADRRRDDAARTQNRFRDEGADGFRILALEGVFQLPDEPGGEFAFAFAVLPLAPVMRGGEMEEALHRQVKI